MGRATIMESPVCYQLVQPGPPGVTLMRLEGRSTMDHGGAALVINAYPQAREACRARA